MNDVQLSSLFIEILNEELSYQNEMAGTSRADCEDHGVPGQIVTMEEYLESARKAWVHTAGDTAALDSIRKVVATGIRALVLYGCPRRLRKHILLTPETCPCEVGRTVVCVVCDGGLDVCAVCGMMEAEIEDQPICPGAEK